MQAMMQRLRTLRNRKKRSDKPFALMAFSMDAINRICQVTEVEKTLLKSRQKPVVLLQAKMNAPVSKQVAPGLETLGIILPYTPLHLLLLEPEPDYPELLVMTSGNLSEEPISYQDGEGFNRLRAIADGFLIHNRDIHMRVDDSVVREERQSIFPVRRARGYAPDAVTLSKPVPRYWLRCITQEYILSHQSTVCVYQPSYRRFGKL